MTVVLDDQIIRFFRFAWLSSIFITLLPLYLGRRNIVSKREVIKIITYFSLYAFIGLLLEVNFIKFGLSKEEFEVILLFGAFILIIFAIPKIHSQLTVKFEQELTLNLNGAFNLIKKTMDQLRAKIIKSEEGKMIISQFKASYSFEFLLEVTISKGPKTQVTMMVTPFGTINNRSRILFLLLVYPVIYAFGENTFGITVPVLEFSFNAEIAFVLFASLIGLMAFLHNSVHKNFVYEFEEIQNEVLLELLRDKVSVPEKKKISDTEESEVRKIPETKFDLQTVRRKAERIKNKQYKLDLENKKNAIKDKIDSVFGKKEELEINPDLIKKQLLIANVNTILNATPVFREINLEEITKKVKHDSSEEIEKIILYLVDSKEVKGEYDIWDNIFYPGDFNSQYIEKTLRDMKLSDGNLDYIKLTRGGDVEIRFRTNKKE